MPGMTISSVAATARDGARQSDGRFGEQAQTSPGDTGPRVSPGALAAGIQQAQDAMDEAFQRMHAAFEASSRAAVFGAACEVRSRLPKAKLMTAEDDSEGGVRRTFQDADGQDVEESADDEDYDDVVRAADQARDELLRYDINPYRPSHLAGQLAVDPKTGLARCETSRYDGHLELAVFDIDDVIAKGL